MAMLNNQMVEYQGQSKWKMDHLHEICIFLHPIEAVQINAESSLHGHRLQHVQVLSTEKSPIAGWFNGIPMNMMNICISRDFENLD